MKRSKFVLENLVIEFPVKQVKCFCVGHDSSRAAVGCADQRIYIYSLLNAQLLRTLAAAHDLAALAIADKDHFLLAAGKQVLLE